GKVWLVANGAINTLERGAITPFRIEGANDFFERVLPAPDGGLWVLANQRLRKWLDGRWVAEFDTGLPAPGNISILFATTSGPILAGTLRDGLLLFKPGTEPVHFDRETGLSHDWVRALCEDREGNLWIGTGAGLNSLRPRKAQTLQSPDDWQG